MLVQAEAGELAGDAEALEIGVGAQVNIAAEHAGPDQGDLDRFGIGGFQSWVRLTNPAVNRTAVCQGLAATSARAWSSTSFSVTSAPPRRLLSSAAAMKA